jgi:hypothetical protein
VAIAGLQIGQPAELESVVEALAGIVQAWAEWQEAVSETWQRQCQPQEEAIEAEPAGAVGDLHSDPFPADVCYRRSGVRPDPNPRRRCRSHYGLAEQGSLPHTQLPSWRPLAVKQAGLSSPW